MRTKNVSSGPGFLTAARATGQPGALYLFLAVVALTGGGAREDILSLVVLRPLSWAFLAWAIYVQPVRQGRAAAAPMSGLLLLAVWAALQLVPLPPSIWTELPGREVFAKIGALVGLEDAWRPISLSPSETFNAFFSLAVPAAAILLVSNLHTRDKSKALIAVMVLALASAAVSFLQLAGPPEGMLYLYRVTNYGEPVGFFSNRNHEAVLCAITIILIGWYVGRSRGRRLVKEDLRPLLFAFIVPLLLFLNLIGGSRLGLTLGVAALLPGLLLGLRNERIVQLVKSSRAKAFGAREASIAFGGLALIVTSLTYFVSRAESLNRFMITDASEEIRAQLLPIFGRMIAAFMPVGSGFGSFEHVYTYFEPIELIERRYLNQAHNDLAQFLIEGGAPAAVLVLLALVWFARRCLAMWRARGSERLFESPALPSAIALAFFAIASIFDYPLRAPIGMAVAAVLVCLLDEVHTWGTEETKQR